MWFKILTEYFFVKTQDVSDTRQFEIGQWLLVPQSHQQGIIQKQLMSSKKCDEYTGGVMLQQREDAHSYSKSEEWVERSFQSLAACYSDRIPVEYEMLFKD